jgi:hypothetical protein
MFHYMSLTKISPTIEGKGQTIITADQCFSTIDSDAGFYT